jgi:Polysaccharide deacetylase/Domain of unknown function (DUF3473)
LPAFTLSLEHGRGPTVPARGGISKRSCYLSVDFEDFRHDFERRLGVSKPRRSPDALWKAYGRLEEFAQRRLFGKRLTFFTTGQVARDHPDIVRRIASDGHEVACHYHEHDQIRYESRDDFRRNLELAVGYLANASGQIIKGFRAPDFSIDHRCASWAYEEISRVFLYDSSCVNNLCLGMPNYPSMFWFPGSYLYEFPIFRRRFLPGLTLRVIGGTYLRLLPTSLTVRLLREAWTEGFIPHVYVHPHDVLYECEQWSRYNALGELSRPKRTYWWIRQHQWHRLGNRGAFRKLDRIYSEFRHPGPMASFFLP